MSNRKVYKKKSFNMQLMKYNFTYKLTYKDDFYNIACIVSVKIMINYYFGSSDKTRQSSRCFLFIMADRDKGLY